MTEIVTCFSGARYADRPVAFRFGGQELQVAAIERHWREPNGLFFVVQTPDSQRFRLSYDEENDHWRVDLLTGNIA